MATTPTSTITMMNITPTTSTNNLNIINNNNNSSTSLSFYDHNDQELMAQENKYKQYALQIDKALKSFEYTSEWADLVSALGKLKRVLTNNSKFGKIPRRFIVGQRLAQCMHPLLPSGVHLKALETYDQIFNIIGTEQLLADLTIYSNGLFPLLGYAAINVRPSVLDLYDRHLLPLGERLQLALDGFLISILPCYEEGSEIFQRTDGLLLKVADGVGIAYFYGALWRCILHNSSIRSSAISFIMIHFNKKRTLKEQAHILGLCMRTLVQAICSALLDQQILIQRAILDLLITIFPIHMNPINQVEQTMNSQQIINNSPNKLQNKSQQQQQAPPPLQPLQQQVMSRKYFKRSEMIVIITASLTVLLRRDFSLNRRLCAWFFGSDSGSSMSSSGALNIQPSSNNNSNTKLKSQSTSILGASASSSISNKDNNSSNNDNKLSRESISENKARLKKLKYYDTYSKDLVNEAFKRCITNPLTAITSFLPSTVLTNSFITFTLPFIPTSDNNVYGGITQTSTSSSSSPSSSTLSLQINSRHHNLYRNNSLHGNLMSRPYINQSTNNKYSSMSTFWPYRLLICIMDQRDIAAPILDKLLIDILRGLYHEFELLTIDVPPPSIITNNDDDNDYDDIDVDYDYGGINNKNNTSQNRNDSTTTTPTLSSSSNKKFKPKQQHQKQQIKKRKKKKLKKNQNQNNQQNVDDNKINKKESLSNSDMPTATTTPTLDRSINNDNRENFNNDKEIIDTNDNDNDKSLLIVKNIDKSSDLIINSDEQNINNNENNNKTMSIQKRNRNFIQNVTQKLKNKLQFPLGHNKNTNNNNNNDNNNNNNDMNQSSNRNMRQVMKTLMPKPIRFRIRPGGNRYKKKDLKNNNSKKNEFNNNKNNNCYYRYKRYYSNDEYDNDNLNYSDNENDDESIFILPHQHYYWNPYYQQLSKEQRQELLKELDRVMHLLFTNIGVEFIWNNLALTFNTASDESIGLQKFINLFIKSSKELLYRKIIRKNQKQDSYDSSEEIDDEDVEDFYEQNDNHDNDDDSQNNYDNNDDEDNNNDGSYESEDDDNNNNIISDDDNDDDDDNGDDLDTISQSLSWIRNLIPTLLLKNVQSISNNFKNYSFGSTTTIDSISSTTSSLKSSSTSNESTVSSSNSSSKPFIESSRLQSSPELDDENDKINKKIKNHIKKSMIREKLLISLNNYCRQCGKILTFSSPVQPVGTESITILESCTLARFLLGDSQPYSYINNNDDVNNEIKINNNDDTGYKTTTTLLSSPPSSSATSTAAAAATTTSTNYNTNSLFINSISVSMNRCSALEPLEVGTINYTFLINFLDHVLRLICDSIKSFTPNDIRASIELCLALCSKLKPAIMQTFTRRYRHEINLMKSKEFDNDMNNQQQSNIVLWFQSYGQQKQQQQQQQQQNIRSKHLRTRSSPSISSSSGKLSNKQLELVREETEDDEESKQEQQKILNDKDDDDNIIDNNNEQWEFNDDFKIELVVDGILKFFSTFIEKILIKKSKSLIKNKNYTNLSKKIIDYFLRIMSKNYYLNDQQKIQQIINSFVINRQQSHYPEIEINTNLLPLYQLFCELLIEIGTIPLLSSPAFLFKKREQKTLINIEQLIKFLNNNDVIDNNNDDINNINWFIYLMALSANGIGSCTHWHDDQFNFDSKIISNNNKIINNNNGIKQNSIIWPYSCCQLRHVSYISLSTMLDLMTMTRAYIVSQPSMYPNLALSSLTNNEFQMPTYIDMTTIDLFPKSFIAKRLNFFPLIHPKMLQFVYESTLWFKIIASGLWSNLSIQDSVLHHSTSALLQQLHSISHDESICEVVICDEMIGGTGFQCVPPATNVNKTISQPYRTSSINMESLRMFNPQHQLSFEQQSRHMEIVHRARTKFALMFSILRDIPFISERLALVVNALASAVRSSSDVDNDIDHLNTLTGIEYSDQLLLNENSSNSKFLSQLEIEIATGMDSNHYQSLMNISMVCNINDLHRLLRITCPISPISLCSTLKRHFDRPLFIMLDALAQRRNLSEQYSLSSDWLLRCIKQPNLFGTKNLMFISPNGFGVTSEFYNYYNNQSIDFFSYDNNNNFDKSGISRILEPLLFILLHPNTARLSIKNVIVRRYNRYQDKDDDFEYHNNPQTPPSASSTSDNQSKIYAITSTNGNFIYHVLRKPSSSLSSSVSSMKFTTNPLENHQKTTKLNDINDLNEIKKILNDMIDVVASEANENEMKNIRLIKNFPGMASFQMKNDNKKDNDDANVNDNNFKTKKIDNNDKNDNDIIGHKLHFAEMHQHLLLYERRYDSLRTIYALDTIISMIETWPSRILYAMSTTTLFNNDISKNISSILDGTRSAQIKTLYQRHCNSINGNGFYPNHQNDNSIIINNNNNINSSTINNRLKSRFKQHDLISETPTSTTNSIDDNMTLLELIIQISLKYLCSYYPSCPADLPSTMTANKLNKKTSLSKGLDGGLLDELFLQIRSNHCIDLEAIYGNQRVRLLSSQLLRIIFRNLSQMIDVRNDNRYETPSSSNKHHKRQPSESLLCLSQSKYYVQYLKELLRRCDVQRNVLQCLATSVWHYQQKNSNINSVQYQSTNNNDNLSNKIKKNSLFNERTHEISSYLFPETKYHNKLNPSDIAFVKEILDYNDYPENINNNNDNDYKQNSMQNDQHGFHDEFEKSLLHLVEQVMILESRINCALIEFSNINHKTSLSLLQLSEMTTTTSTIIPRVSFKDMTEINFDPELPLLGQTLMNGALYYALQQNFRRRLHTEWLSFIESSLHYAGRFMPRLVLTSLNQLCRNIDSITKEIDKFANSSCFVSSELNLPPFIHKNFSQTLQAIAMIYSYCLLDRNQYELLAPVINELFNENHDDWARSFGLAFNTRNYYRFDADSSVFTEHKIFGQNNGTASVSSNGSSGAIQTLSSFLQNIMTLPISVNSNATTINTSSSSNDDHQSDQTTNTNDSGVVLLQQDTLSNNLALTRQRILDYTSLNRVLTALFQVWCTMIVHEDVDDDNLSNNNNSNNKNNSNNNNNNTNSKQYSINQPSSACCHPYVRQFHSIDSNEKNLKNYRYSQSNCSLGWSSSLYTGWYITGSSMILRHSIITILNIVAVSNGVSLMKSIARLWHDLRDRCHHHQHNSSETSILSDSIDMVITPATPAQQQLIHLISSLHPIMNLGYLIEIIRTVLKPSSSISLSTATSSSSSTISTTATTSSALTITTEVESTQYSFTSNPFDNIFLIEVSLLEFFLAYIRAYPVDLLIRNSRPVLALIKDSFALNLNASVPYETFLPRSKRRHLIMTSSSVQINFQPLINIHLLAIIYEFISKSPFVEERRIQKELQDVTHRLIDAIIEIAGGRLLPSRFWSFRRNLEVMPLNTDHQIGYQHYLQQTGCSSSTSSTPITEETLSDNHNEQNVTIKRGLFRSSASVQFQTAATSTNDTNQEQQHSQNDGLLFGLFNLNLSYLSSGSNNQDLANTSQNLFQNYFCIKSLYAMAKFAAPVLDVVYASEEKEKMIPLIVSLMSNVIPYLKSHSQHNLPCFDASSRLLASFSGYQYTRKAWRRDSLELLLDPTFFQMPSECIQSWRTIIDHLMTHDKNTFREFLQRMSTAQSPSVSFRIFGPSSTKDQESEPRAQLVKRLAFILFCSEKDQYQKYMAEIQEKLIEIHRTSQQQTQSSQLINSQSLLQSQVLLAFRVILLRMSPHSLASLWPFIYTEMFQAFLSIEQALLKVIRDEQKNNSNNDHKYNDTISSYHNNAIHLDIPDFLINQSSLMHRSSSVNFIQQNRTTKLEPKISPSQLQLFLNACKLLDLALLLPSDILPQFQLHKWAFINTDSFPLSTTNIRQPLDWLGGISPFSEPIILNSVGDSSVQQPNSLISNSSHTNDHPTSSPILPSLPSSSSSSLILGLMDTSKCSETISLNSSPTTFDSQSNGAPQSLPANINVSLSGQSTITLNNQYANNIIINNSNNNEATFVPHVVLINHLLNYLTDSIPNVTQSCTTIGPLLTMSSIESIHDLHPFFASILMRSEQRTMLNDHQFNNNRNSSSLDNHQQSNRRNFSKNKLKTESKNKENNNNSDQTLMNGSSSLDELYIHIDRIISNDFLEPIPLPTSSTSE